MIGRQEILWFSIGFAASAVAVVTFGAAPARAQSRFDTTVQSAPQPALGNQRQRQRQRAIPRPPLEDEEQVVVPRAPRRDGPQEDGDPDLADTAENSNGAGNANGQRRAAAQRTPGASGAAEPPQDGDLSFPREPEPQPDGLPIETTNPDDPNADPGQVDARFREDVDAFERPVAGYDALAFQIEDMEPLLDERPLRLFRFEPYDPIGIRKGSFVVFPALEIAGFATNNLTGAGPRSGASALELTPSVRAVSDWRRHAMEFRATGLATFFNEDSSQNDRGYVLETRGRLDVSRRTNIEILAVTALSQEGRTARDAVDAAVGRTDIHTNRVAAALNHRFNRLSVQLRGSLTDVDYDGVRTNTGGFITNAQRDVTSKEAATRATWQFKPSLAGFAEAGVVNRDFRAPADDGIARDFERRTLSLRRGIWVEQPISARRSQPRLGSAAA